MFVLSDVLARSEILPTEDTTEIYEDVRPDLLQWIHIPDGCNDSLVFSDGALAILKAIALHKESPRPLTSLHIAETFVTSLRTLDARYAMLVPSTVTILNELCEIASKPKVEKTEVNDEPRGWFSASLTNPDLSIPADGAPVQ